MIRSKLGYFSFGDNLSDKVKIEYADIKNSTSLHTCAVCAAKNLTLLCPDCGFDNSCNYELYPSLQKIDARTPSVSQLIEQRNSSAEPSVEKTIDFLKKQNWNGHVLSAVEEILTFAANGSFTEYHHNEIKRILGTEVSATAQVKKITPVNTNSNVERLKNIVFSNSVSSREDRDAICEMGKKKLANQNYDEGFKFVQYAAKKGSMDGAILLGYCYDNGLGVKQDKKIAEAYYRQGTVSNPDYKSFYQNKYGVMDGGLFETAAKAAKRMLNDANTPLRTDEVKKQNINIPLTENKPESKPQTPATLYQSLKNKLFSIEKSKENQLWTIVNEGRKPTDEENAEILNLGKKLLKSGKTADGIKLIRFTAQQSYPYGSLLLGYCYDNGIGVPKDYSIATAYYNRAGVSGKADESFKYHGLGDRTHRSRAYAAAEKLYKTVEISQSNSYSSLNITKHKKNDYFYVGNIEKNSPDPEAAVQAIVKDKTRNKTIYIQGDKYSPPEVSSYFSIDSYMVIKKADGLWYLNQKLNTLFNISINGKAAKSSYDRQLNNGDIITLESQPGKIFRSEFAGKKFVYQIFTDGIQN